MMSILRFDVTDEAGFVQRAETALRVLAARPGYLRGRAGRSTDEPTRWVIVTDGAMSVPTGGRWAVTRSSCTPRRCSASRSTTRRPSRS